MFSRGIDKQHRAVMGLCKLRQVVFVIYGRSVTNHGKMYYMFYSSSNILLQIATSYGIITNYVKKLLRVTTGIKNFTVTTNYHVSVS